LQAHENLELRFWITDPQGCEDWAQIIRDDAISQPVRAHSDCQINSQSLKICFTLQQVGVSDLTILVLKRESLLDFSHLKRHELVILDSIGMIFDQDSSSLVQPAVLCQPLANSQSSGT
jgi:hypothetical protein